MFMHTLILDVYMKTNSLIICHYQSKYTVQNLSQKKDTLEFQTIKIPFVMVKF